MGGDDGVQQWFVDCHSHGVPSGDDGAKTLDEGRALCRDAARHGTRTLFATPHVWPELPLTPDREAAIRAAFEAIADDGALELRLGFELTPSPALLDDDVARYRLDETSCVLMEVPFVGSARDLVRLGERTNAAGLTPVVAHPERSDAVEARPSLAHELAARGWLLQVNASSLLGHHGGDVEALAWQLVDEDVVSLVASDGHRSTRPPYVDAAYELVSARIGRARAQRLFDGSALARGGADGAVSSRAQLSRG